MKTARKVEFRPYPETKNYGVFRVEIENGDVFEWRARRSEYETFAEYIRVGSSDASRT